jgi:resuscitation-promoting factor RpfB
LLRSVKYGLYAAVLVGVVGGSVAWTTAEKTVTVLVDGQASTVHTTATDVRGVLGSAGYHLSSHDIVAPSPASAVHDHGKIVYKRGRLLRLDVDGVRKDVWTTAPTVAQALAELGYGRNDFTSVSRARRLPLGATAIAVRTAKDVVLVRGGTPQHVTTTELTAADLLRDLNIPLQSTWLSVPAYAALNDNEQVVVKSLLRRTATVLIPIRHAVNSVADPTLPTGETSVVTAGRDGAARVTYAYVFLDGKLASRTTIGSAAVQAPVTEVVKVGTAPLPPVTTPAGAQAYARTQLAKYGWGQDQMSCLITMWDHESGWRYQAENPSSGAYGIPQALPGSKMGPGWQSDPRVQIAWGLSYIKSRYVSPCQAWSTWQAHGGWY